MSTFMGNYMKYLFFLIFILFAGCGSNSAANDGDINDEEKDSDTILDSDSYFDSDIENADERDDDDLVDNNTLVNLSDWERVSDGFEFNYYSNRSITFLNGQYYLVSGDEVYSSVDGINWLTVCNNAPFKSRKGHSVVKFKENMLIVGGGVYTSLGDIWYSKDGVVWDILTRFAPFGARTNLSAIEFKDSLWILGGSFVHNTCEVCSGSEIWSTNDLENWEIKVSEAPFGNLYSQELIEHKNELWLFATHDENTKNSVWRSTDGISWESIADVLPFDARSSVSFYSWKGKLWLAGGYGSDYNYFSDVWSSEDGVEWVKTGNFEEFGGRYKSTVIANEKEVLLISGYQQKSANLKQILSTEDGVNWKLKWGSEYLPDRFAHTVDRFKDKFWVIGGRIRYSEDGVELRDVYSSEDGRKWDRVVSNAPFGSRIGHASVVYKDRIWIFGGYFSSGPYNGGDVWSSKDGVDWNVDSVKAPFHLRSIDDAVVYEDEMVLVGGVSDSAEKVLWYSKDGVNWRKGENIDFAECDNSKMVVHEGSLFLIGGCTEDRYGNEVYRKNDEGDWIKLETENVFSPRRAHRVASMGGFIWVIAGKDGDDLNDVWYSKDGKKWYQEKNAAFSPRAEFDILSYDSKIWVFGGGGSAENSHDYGDVWVVEIESVKQREETPENDSENPDFNDIKWKSAGNDIPSERFDHSFLKTDDGFYIIGGRLWGDDLYEIENSAIFSSDGASWEILITNEVLLDKIGVAYVYFKDKIWGIGGNSDSIDFYGQAVTNQIIFSENGKDWQIAVESPEITPRYNHKAVVFKDRIWVVGGFDADENGLDDVWSSEDGINWKREVSVSDFRGRGVHGLHVLNDRIYMIGGMRNSWDNGSSEVWSSEDGISWERDSYLGFSQRRMFGSTVASGVLWVFGGAGREGELNDLYYSSDGRKWNKAECNYVVSKRRGSVILGDDNRLWLSGGVFTDSSYVAHTYKDVWFADISIK